MDTVKVLATPTKSLNDKKDYRIIQLPNGLKAILVSDSPLIGDHEQSDSEDDEDFESCDDESDEGSMSENSENEDNNEDDLDKDEQKQAAAALCINVGSFSDPDNIPGLAHFLEHMVFMGSKTYPNENHFDKFIQSHGGYDNASTDSERTMFQFEVNPKNFKQALKIWSKFFICPLMTFSAIGREVKAVDAEFKMATVDEQSRLEQLIGNLCATGHPVTKFLWGNEESLFTSPQENGTDVYKALHGFRKKYYLAQNMTLAVQSTETLDTLETWVKEIFADVPNVEETNNKTINGMVTEKIPKFKHEEFTMLNVVPIQNIQELHLVWFLPTMIKEYKSKPLYYVLWMLAHEGPGSLLSNLKQKHLATSIHVNEDDRSGFDDNSIYSLVLLQITLTDKGLQKKEEVLDSIFMYMLMLRSEGSLERIFTELQQIERNNFTYKEECSPLSNVETCAENLLLYAPEDNLTGDYLLTEFKKELIDHILNQLLPNKCLILLYTPLNQSLSNLNKEPWFKTEYNVEQLDKTWVKRWMDIGSIAINDTIHLPSANQFIPANFNIVKQPKTEEDKKIKYPRLVINESSLKVWFKMDTKFLLPKAYLYLNFANPTLSTTPENQVYLDLFVALLDYNLSELLFDAAASSFCYTLSISMTYGIEIKISGFCDKLELVLEKVLHQLFNFTVSETVFQEQQTLLRKEYYNKLLNSKKLCKDVRLTLLEQRRFSLHDKHAETEHISHPAFLSFTRQYFEQVQIDGLIQGNINEDDCHAMAQKVKRYVGVKGPLCRLKSDRILIVPEARHFVKVRATNMADENSMVTVYLQSGPCTIQSSVRLELLNNMMSEPCFDVLRTNQQLGYSVWVDDHNTSGVLALSCNVQSQNSKFSVEKLTFAIGEFLRGDFFRLLKGMTSDDFDEHVESLIDLKKVEDTQLVDEVARNWDEILSGDLLFDRLEHELRHLDTVTHEELLSFYEQLSLQKARQLTVQVRGNDMAGNTEASTPKLEYLDEISGVQSGAGKRISSIASFRNLAQYYQVCNTQL